MTITAVETIPEPVSTSASSLCSVNEYVLPAKTELRQARGPCPGLNALANCGFISRSGQSISFLDFFRALKTVYALSWLLALLLVLPAFFLYGKFRIRFRRHAFSLCFVPILTVDWTLDLASLSSFGPRKFAHRASLIHADRPGHEPVRDMWNDLEKIVGDSGKGMTLRDLALLRIQRENRQETLSGLHQQIALGESGLMWAVLKSPLPSSSLKVEARRHEGIPMDRLREFLVEERIPGPWLVIGNKKTIGLVDARTVATDVGAMMKDLRASGSTAM